MVAFVFRQLINRRKSNIWLAVALMIIFCFVWYIVDFLFVLGYNRLIPSYQHLENTYLLNIGVLPEDNPSYQPEEPEEVAQNYFRLINRLKQHPSVEAVGISLYQSYPESGSLSSDGYMNPEDSTKTVSAQKISILPQGDYLNVFAHTQEKGKKDVSIADFDWSDPNAVVISQLVANKLFPDGFAVGKQIKETHGEEVYTIKGVIDDTKRFWFERPRPYIILSESVKEEELPYVTDIMIRIKDNPMKTDFIPAFKKEMAGALAIGNLYLNNVTSFQTIRDNIDFMYGIKNKIQTHFIMMIFFLFNIMLCLVGTFWYRVEARKEEIGIHRALGGTALTIRKLFFAEGIIILTLVMFPALLIEFQFIHFDMIETMGVNDITKGLYLPDKTILRFLITNVLTWFILAVIIIVSIWYPALAAGRIQPVEALRDE